ncbi:MAG: hypothetical protein KGN84_17035 [Acidobacteriota bacterium]|nr:hypothetical protein [Acidobacteriota bacterium]
MSTCDRAEALRDYAFDELPAADRPGMERHIAECGECAAELDRLQLTTAALRVLPSREAPQRIAFVSDKVFEPSPFARFFPGIWNSAARLGFASACVLAAALIVSAYHRTAPGASPEVRTIVQKVDVSQQRIDAAIAKAVAEVHEDDARVTNAALEQAELRHRREHLALLDAVRVLQDRLNTNTLLASAETTNNPVSGQ